METQSHKSAYGLAQIVIYKKDLLIQFLKNVYLFALFLSVYTVILQLENAQVHAIH